MPLRLLLAFIVALLTLTLAAPAGAVDDPTAGPARKNPLPVKITITSIAPTIATAGEAAPTGVTVTATITNTGEQPIDDLWVRLQRAGRVDSRAALGAIDAKQPPYDGATGPETDLPDPLTPGGAQTITLTASFAELAISDSGTYPILINLNGEINGDASRVGQAAFYLPYADAITGQVQAAWLWPLIDRPRQSATAGIFLDDELAAQISDGGRLDTLLQAAEDGGTAAKLTLLIDPALVADLAAMRDGYTFRGPDGTLLPGKGQADAATYLSRLTDLAAKVPVATTSYGDMDTVALVRAGLGELVSRSRNYGSSIVESELGVSTIDDLDWPENGVITTDAAAADQVAGVSRFVLSGAAYGQDDYLSSPDSVTESAASPMPDGATALVADPALSRIIGEGQAYAAGPVAATQRLTTELFTIVQEAPTRVRNVVLTPPRRWAPEPEYAESLLALTSSTPWIAPLGLDEVASAPAVDRGALVYPTSLSQNELPANSLDELPPVMAELSSLSSVFTADEVDQVIGQPTAALYGAASTSLRGDPQRFATVVNGINQQLQNVRNAVRIVPPSNGTYTLSSSEAPLVFTIENTLGVTVRYRITLDEARSRGLSAEDSGTLEIGPNQRATVQLNTTVERSGSFSVVAKLVTPEGAPLGEDVRIRVTSSAYGTVALAVTGAAFVMLLLLIGRRAFKRHRFRTEQRALLATDIAPHEVRLEPDLIGTSWLDEPVPDNADAADEPDSSAEPRSRPPKDGA
ncbi:hypothetical protein EK0264_09500 [Epidermidibacterium keratini]|uniref:Glycoprotein n=1 Tax=Epidermidibacterium keratini TaxID=1891644 RepID=A0A7L4YMI0_9ACTN|nr:DUF6049 family protein [Epidermidibacterium keratini]QHC00491.1 hypothetical protein EK0264_09500 [Epidermidibacterium keratini]